MRYTILTLITLLYFTNVNAQGCASVKEKLLQIVQLKVAYEKTLDRDMVQYFKREDKNYDPDISKARKQYVDAISKIKSDRFAKMCIETMIMKNDTVFKRYNIKYSYLNPLLSTIPEGTFITKMDYVKAFHYSVFVVDSDTLLPARRIPSLDHLFKD